MVTGFSRLGALSTRNDAPSKASRPFDIDRDGFVLGEGAGVMVLTTKMKQPDIGPLQGWVLGAGITSNAWRITDSPPQGRGAMAAMLGAVNDAGVTASEVVYVNAHGTSTAQNDRSEAQAISAAFGPNGPLVSSTKSTMGHLVAACGVVEALITMRAVTECIAPPTANLENPDPECPVRHVPVHALALPRGVGISNAFGFGGTNASVVMAAP
jgi:3-oxoacyl-[acyl-carrier-protein] synthase II